VPLMVLGMKADMIIKTNYISRILNDVAGEFLILANDRDEVDLDVFGEDLADSIYRSFHKQCLTVPDILKECEAEFFSALAIRFSERMRKPEVAKCHLSAKDAELH